MAAQHGDLSNLLPPTYKRMITAWLEEDCPSFDYGGFVVGEVEGEARLLGKSKVRFFLIKSSRRYSVGTSTLLFSRCVNFPYSCAYGSSQCLRHQERSDADMNSTYHCARLPQVFLL